MIFGVEKGGRNWNGLHGMSLGDIDNVLFLDFGDVTQVFIV